MSMVTPIAHHGTPTVSHGVAYDFMARCGPAATATALHSNPTECHGNPHGTPMSTAPKLSDATGGTTATPAATATALHGHPTGCHSDPHGTPMFTAPISWG